MTACSAGLTGQLALPFFFGLTMSTDAPKWTWTKVRALAWNRFRLEHLNIRPSLLGASHHLTVDGLSVEIRLPGFPPNTPSTMHQWDEEEDIFCHSWRHKKPVAYLVNAVDVVVDTGKNVGIPVERLGTVKHDWQSKETYEKNDKLSHASAAVAFKAFQLWLRTFRWKTLNPHFGQRRATTQRSGWGTYLYDASTKKRFFGATVKMVGGGLGGNPLDRTAWNKVQRALTKGAVPPVWFEFAFEGQHRVSQGDLHGGILCHAIAVETVIRLLMKTHLKSPPNEPVMDMLDFVQIRRILDHWQNLGYWSPKWQAATDLTLLKRLFTLRNSVMHKAVMQTNVAECFQIGKAVLKFIVQASPTAERLS
jgi:hypothetical protein